MDAVNDTTLDVDLTGPECDLQDDDFQMLDEDDGGLEPVHSNSAPSDVENGESDDDLDTIPNLFRSRTALKAALKGSQDEDKETGINNASGELQLVFGCRKCYNLALHFVSAFSFPALL